MRGHPRTLLFNLVGALAGGSATSELRVSQRIERPFWIRSVEIIPSAGVVVGQYVDVLISGDDDIADVSDTSGFTIFEKGLGFDLQPVVDQGRGVPVSEIPYDVPIAYFCPDPGRNIKVIQTFQAPAATLAALHVVVVIEEIDCAAPPIEPRPPIGPRPPLIPPVVAPPGGEPYEPGDPQRPPPPPAAGPENPEAPKKATPPWRQTCRGGLTVAQQQRDLALGLMNCNTPGWTHAKQVKAAQEYVAAQKALLAQATRTHGS